MQKKKKGESKSNAIQPPVQKSNDPFMRRREVQGTLIKKMLAEFDLPAKPEMDLKPDDKMNYLCFEPEETEGKES